MVFKGSDDHRIGLSQYLSGADANEVRRTTAARGGSAVVFCTWFQFLLRANQQREARKREVAGRVIYDVHLAGIEPGLELA